MVAVTVNKIQIAQGTFEEAQVQFKAGETVVGATAFHAAVESAIAFEEEVAFDAQDVQAVLVNKEGQALAQAAIPAAKFAEEAGEFQLVGETAQATLALSFKAN